MTLQEERRTFASKAARDAWIAEEAGSGRTQQEIADRLGLSRTRVTQVLQQARRPPAAARAGRATWETVYEALCTGYLARRREVWDALHQERPLAILGAGILSGFGPEEVAREIARELGWRRREETP